MSTAGSLPSKSGLDRDDAARTGGSQIIMTRRERGAAKFAEATGAAFAEPKTLLESTIGDFAHADVWTRPGLGLRERLLIALAGTAVTRDSAACQSYASGALKGGYISLTELREAALHIGVYDGWATGKVLDTAITLAAGTLGLAEAVFDPLPDDPADPAERLTRGAEGFKRVAQTDAPPPMTPYLDTGVLNFVMSDVWSRPGLDERARRCVALVGAGFSSAPTPMRSHTYSALASRALNKAELLELVLQFALFAGWPRGAAFQSAVLEQAARVEKGLPFQP
jgi:4-carboxymuconolactone decarboxylase